MTIFGYSKRDSLKLAYVMIMVALMHTTVPLYMVHSFIMFRQTSWRHPAVYIRKAPISIRVTQQLIVKNNIKHIAMHRIAIHRHAINN